MSSITESPSESDPTSISDSMSRLRSQLTFYRQALKAFTSSASTFKVLSSFPHTPAAKPLPSPKTLYILDSSFNPPTLAHLRIALSALLKDEHPDVRFPKRLILLLAIQNADKAPKPAAFEERLVMMEVFAHDLLSTWRKASSEAGASSSTTSSSAERDVDARTAEDISIDIALTTHPYFMDKATSISQSSSYSPETPQIHLVGYDTLIRILDPKYYPPAHTLAPLVPFLAKHRLRVTYRTDDSWGAKQAQDRYLRELGEGKRDGEAAKREWVTEGRIVLCDGRKEGEEPVSSTKVRDAVKRGDEEMLGRLVSQGVKEWILEEGLYVND